MLCDILECRVEDVLEYRPDKPADKETDSDDTKEKETNAASGKSGGDFVQ